MTHHANMQKGFTLVELMLALAFISFVLIFATTTIIQVMRTYNKGLAVKEINQTARTTMDEISRTIKASPTDVTVVASANRACLGSITYVWNYRSDSLNSYTDDSRVKFARVNDAGKSLCTPTAGVYPKVTKANATELLSDSVWVQQLTVAPTVGNSFFDVFLQLSTAEDAGNPSLVYSWANPNPEQRVVCKGGNEGQFCAVASFSTSVNAQGGSN